MLEFKEQVYFNLIENLEDNLSSLVKSANAAKDAATSPESKAEHKYDTRGLEASYLAGAQAERVDELIEQIQKLKSIPLDKLKHKLVESFALVKLLKNDEHEVYFLMLPFQGGVEVSSQDKIIKTITPTSPLGKKLVGKKVDGLFEIEISGVVDEYEVLEII